MATEFAPVWSPSQAAAEREAKRRPVFYTYINLWPFVGVLLVLLIIFMIKDPPILHDIGPDLPSSSYATAQARALREDAIKISIMRDGRVYSRTQQVELKSLPMLIHRAVEEGAENRIYLAVDSRAKYGDAAAVVDQIGNSGIREICFLVYKREK